jgi:hypothetical protein
MAQALGPRHSDSAVRGRREEDVSYRPFGRSGLYVSQLFRVAVGDAALVTSAIGIVFNETEKNHVRRKHIGQDDDRRCGTIS